MPWPLSTHGKDPVPIVQEAGWATKLYWTGAENLAPSGITLQCVLQFQGECVVYRHTVLVGGCRWDVECGAVQQKGMCS
jgi:hypothetical protein